MFGDEGVAGYLDKIYRMVSHAARYGHQQQSEMMALTFEQAARFNDSLSYWLEIENGPSK